MDISKYESIYLLFVPPLLRVEFELLIEVGKYLMVAKILQTFIFTCKECPNSKYYSGGVSECKLTGRRMSGEAFANEIADDCPLPWAGKQDQNLTVATVATNADRFRFGIIVGHTIQRYLMCNTPGRMDGNEKAIRHRELCEAFIAFHYLVPINKAYEYNRDWRDDKRKCYGSPNPEESDVWLVGTGPYDFVHAHTRLLTGNLDMIGLPMDGSFPDYDAIAEKFLVRFYHLATEAVGFWLESKPV